MMIVRHFLIWAAFAGCHMLEGKEFNSNLRSLPQSYVRSLGKNSTFLDHKNNTDEKDADTNDDEVLLEDIDLTTGTTTGLTKDEDSRNSGTFQGKGEDHSTPWFTLSHYIPPNTTLYDVIEGFLFAMLFCFIISTCYNCLYYWCFVRCGLCPDDRIYKSLLHRRGRKRRRIGSSARFGRGGRNRHRGPTMKGSGESKCCGICCCFQCCCPKSSDGYDGRGYFTPLGVDMNHDVEDDDEKAYEHELQEIDRDSDDYSSLSNDSELTLEYGECQLDDEYGEGNRTDRLGEKVEAAAHKFFSTDDMKEVDEFNDTASKKSARSRKSKRSRKSRGFRLKRSDKSIARSVKSQASSILSSSSGESSFCSSSSNEEDDFEVAEAMMDLHHIEEKVHQNMANNDTV